ncbi:MAG: diguanylate cyclase [Planctomycetes bacterium]|nr:diguanylate cyclase [Planctomycetota bacterium]
MTAEDPKFLDEKSLPGNLRDVQNRVVNLALTALLVLALPAVIASLTQAARSGWAPNICAQVAAYAVVLLAGVFRSRLPFALRAGLLFTAGFVVGLGELLTWGRSGTSEVQFILVSVFAVILLGVRMGLVLALLGTVVSVVVGWSQSHGWLTFAAGGASASWVAHAMSYTAAALLLVVSLGRVHAGLAQAIRGLTRRGRRLAEEVQERTRAEREVRQLNDELEQRVRLRTQKVKMLSKAVEHTPVSVVITDAAGVIEFTNDAFTRSCGYTRDEIAGKTPRLLASGKTPKEVIKNLWDTLLAGREWHGEFCNRRKDGTEYIEEAWISPLCDDEGTIEKFVAVKLDITKRRELERALERMSRTDALTNLANRRAFEESLQREVSRATRAGRPLSLLMLDVDHFKRYNDTYGHQAGDRALQRVAGVLTSAGRRGGDTAARYGGEEFTVILAEADAQAAAHVAEAILRGVEELAIPHESSATAPHVTVSVGIATMVPGAAIEAEALLRLADTALYDAKARGRNGVQAAAGAGSPA